MMFYVDYRFVVEAESREDAGVKVERLIKDATDDVWYTLSSIEEAVK